MTTSDPRVTSTTRLADRLAAARRRRFVGRQNEVALFTSALHEIEPPFAVLHVYGPGGVGKTTLLAEYRDLATQAGWETILLDGRNMEASPPGFLISLATAIGVSDGRSPLEALGADWRGVIFVDTYELINPLDGWLREVFLPQLPAHSLVVLAGRNAPAPAWRADPGWSELVRVVPLRNLAPDESRSYLDARGIDGTQQQAALSFTHGHPLALSLVADLLAQGDSLAAFDSAEHPDVVGTLVNRFLHGVPSPDHRAAIEMCAHTRVTTESLLAGVFGEETGHALFAWLRGLSFIEQSPEGLFPHDLARDVIDADVHWRDPEAYWRIHTQVREPIIERIRRSQGIEQQRAVFDLLFLHRNNPYMKPLYDFKALGTAYAEPATSRDFPVIVELIRRHESEESARIAEYWIERQPESFVVFRTHSDDLIGFACGLFLEDVSEEDLAIDPAVKAAWEYIERYGPLRPGEQVLIDRNGMSKDGYYGEAVGETVNMLGALFAIAVMTNPRLAWSFIQVPGDVDYWHESLVYLNQHPSPEADYEIGGRHYSAYTHDWRVEPPHAWLETMARREIATDLKLEVLEAARPTPVLVLSREEFEEAVRRALRDYTRPANLEKNPLLRSRLIENGGDGSAPAERLRALIREAAETLRANPKDERLYRAVRRTYLEPAATQELAAEALGLPFSTYRYHLTHGVQRISAMLWERELSPADDG
jgi:hypothetical protein